MGYSAIFLFLGTITVAISLLPPGGTTRVDENSRENDTAQIKERLRGVLSRLDQLETSFKSFFLKENNEGFWTPGQNGKPGERGEPGQSGETGDAGRMYLPGPHSKIDHSGLRGYPRVPDGPDATATTRLEKELEKLKRTMKILAGAATVPASRKKLARVLRSHIIAKENTSQILACESHGDALNLCMWGRTVRSQRQIISMIQKDAVAQSVGHAEIDRISVFGDGLQNGTCSLRIESITEEDFGTYACTLFDQAGALLTGQVEIYAEEPEATLYFGTNLEGLQAYSMATSEVKLVIDNGPTGAVDVTYDSSQDKIYWSGVDKVYRGNRDGSEVETVFTAKEHGLIWALDFDWIAGNIYAMTTEGHIIACDTSKARPLPCVRVLSGEGIEGIILNPNEGMMYFTSKSHNGSVNRAGMDGSHQVPLVTGLNSPNRITIDFQNSRLYWTCGEDEIQSSSMQGTDVQTVVRHPGGSHPWGIGVSSDRIYWTDFTTMKIGSCTKTGQDVQILHTGTCHLGSLAIVPRWNLPTNRTNHCKNRSCSKVCVLTPTSFSCLS